MKSESIDNFLVHLHNNDIAWLKSTLKEDMSLLDSVDEYGNNLLILSVLYKNYSFCKALIEAGIDESRKNNEGIAALESAIQLGNKRIIKLLLNERNVLSLNRNNFKLIHAAAVYGNINLLRKAISTYNFDINAKSYGGFSPLRWAVQERKYNTVEYLLLNGADINSCDDEGFDSIYIAVAQGDKHMVYLLVAYGADLKRSYNGETLVDIALAWGHKIIASFFESKGVKAQDGIEVRIS